MGIFPLIISFQVILFQLDYYITQEIFLINAKQTNI